MIRRTFVHVAGPPAAGKTTLVEDVLTHDRQNLIAAARCRRDDALTEPQETAPETDPELGRYRAAGAMMVTRYDFPATRDTQDAFFQSDLMGAYSAAVVLEGDAPPMRSDISVFVAPAAAGGLLVRHETDPADVRRARREALQYMLDAPEGPTTVLGAELGEFWVQLARAHPEVVEERRRALREELDSLNLPQDPAPAPVTRWAIAEPYRGIQRAQLVVVNVRDPAERDSGEALLGEVARLRSDRAVSADVMGPRDNRRPITTVVANLTDAKDPGTKKALARVRRVLRQDH